MGDYVGQEIILNLAYYLYKTNQGIDLTKKIPTIMKLFYDLNLLKDVN